jgi:hypothetical protein
MAFREKEFDVAPSGKLSTKLSTQIDGQLPDFIQADHPVFSRFLKHYYQYLEAGELRIISNIDNLLLNLESKSFVLDVDGNKIVLENGVGVATGDVNLSSYGGGKFNIGETITGDTSKATATVLVDDLGNASTPRLFITSQQKFITGETITGGTSNSSGTVVRYRANPVQNIQQLLDYADVDNTIYDFLDNFRDEFMNAIPLTLATGLDKRNLIKNIRELYRAKGTSEGHKIFMRMLLGETADVIYPNKYMMRASDGKWGNKTIMRVAPLTNIPATEAIGTIINGKTSDATALIASATSFSEGGAAIVEFELNPDSISTKFTFTEGETLSTTSTVQDITMTFTLKNIISTGVVTNRSALYTEAQDIDFDTNTSIGNGLATARIENIISGSVSDVVIDDAGTKYEVGDTLTFTTSDSSTIAAEGFVSIIDGSLVLDGTDTKSTNAGDFLISEDGTTTHVELFSIEMERATASSLGEHIILDNAYDATAIQVESGTSSVGNIILNGADSSKTDDGGKLELEAYHDVVASHAGHSFIMESSINQTSKDTYSSGSDRFAIEETTDYSGAISRIFLKTGGLGYVTIPTVSVSTTTGTSTSLLAVTDSIGAVGDVEITNQGFNYSVAPDMTFPANFTLKDVTGTFAAANTLTTHTGTVQAWNSTTNVLTTTFEDVIRSTLETGATEGIALEKSLRIGSDNRDTLVGINRSIDEEDQIVDTDGNRFILNATKTLDEYIVLEGGEGETSGSAIVLESPTDSFFPPLQLEYGSRDGTNIGDGIANESGTGDILLSETAISLGDNTHARQLERILTERSQRIASRLSGVGTYLITDSSEDTETSSNIILNATDSSQTDADDNLQNEEFGDKNTIILNGTDSDSSNANAKILMAIEAADGVVALNGTNSDGTNGGDSVIQESEIDFFDGATGIAKYPTTITDSGGATGTIVKANIAKGTSTIDVTMETLKSYSSNIESLIGEDLNRIQDSYYYQQFSYEVQSGFGTSSYLNQLKKAVHPAGWAVFGKTKVASSISAAITNAGSSLGGGWFSDLGVTAPADQFSPILASTFQILFSEVTKRRLGVVDIANGAFEEHIVLEDSEDIKVVGDSIVLDSSEIFEVAIEHGGTDGAGANAGDNIVLNGTDSSSTNAADQLIIEGYSNAGSYVIEETPIFHFDDFAGVQLEDGTDTDAGGYGVIKLNGTDSSSTNANERIISEKSVAVTANLVMDRSEGLTSQPASPDAGGDILIDGINDSYLLLFSTEHSYDKMILEAGLSNGYLLSESNSVSDVGESMELEDASAGIVFNKVGLQGNQVLTSLLNEDGGSQQLETSFKGGGPNHDVSLVTFISRKINLPQSTPRHLSTGLITLARNPFPNQVSRFELEKGTATGGYLLVNNDNFQVGLSTTTGHGPDEVIRGEHPIDAGVKFILEDAADPNNDSNFTFENIGNYSNDNIIIEQSGDASFILVEAGIASSGFIVLNGTDSDSTNAGEQIQQDNSGPTFIVLNGIDSSSTAAGHRVVGESVVQYDFYTLSDIIRPSLLVIDSHIDDGLGPTGGSTPVSNTAIILEESSASGFFMQEDGSTASEAHGDNILLESKTGFGNDNKLELESDRIIVENYLNSGTIPFQNYINSTLPPITRPSDILISEYGAIDLEDETNGSLILNGTDGSSTNADGRFRFEVATDDNININYPNV